MADLTLGSTPDKLTLNLVLGDPFSAALTLKQDGDPISWPVAPALEFPGVLDDDEHATAWTAELSETDSKATWSATEDQVAAVLAATNKKVRLSVSGVTWWAGVAVSRAS